MRNFALIFDMDGVLVDTEPLKFQAYQKVFASEFGVQIEEDTARAGQHEPAVMQLYLKKQGLMSDIDELIVKKRTAYYKILTDRPVPLFAGVPEFLAKLKKQGIRLGLATSSDRKSAKIILGRSGLDKLLDLVLTQEDVERKKPAPDIYLKSAELLKVKPSDCIVVEDSPVGVEAAKAAGMKCIGIATGIMIEKLREAGAELVVDSLFQIPDAIFNIPNSKI